MIPVSFYSKGALQVEQGEVVAEYPVPLVVNGQEMATLVASPHELNFLVAGFLRLQGFISQLSDIEMLSVCQDFGGANVRIKGELPQRLKPVLTSGCGTGITFATPAATQVAAENRYAPEQIFALMDELGKRAQRYRSHGGIHSAAVGDGKKMLLYAEDLGRHNTLDRIAGEALFKGIDLNGLMLVTSGRISTEMAAKAAQLGIVLLASRTSPTDMAVRLCDESGLTLIGYLRAATFQLYTHPERLLIPAAMIDNVTGVILAGGKSSRMGCNKALLDYQGEPLIASVYKTLARIFTRVMVVTNTPAEYDFLPCVKVPDVFAEKGSLAGIHAALQAAPSERIFVVACDMPHLDEKLIRYLAGIPGAAAVVPRSECGFEPLHAVYSKEALPAFTRALQADRMKIFDLFEQVGAKIVPPEELSAVSADFSSFDNMNTPEEYSRLQA